MALINGYAIDTKTESNKYKGIDWTVLDYFENKRYRELYEAEQDGQLETLMATDGRQNKHRAAYFHGPDMLRGIKPKYKSNEEGLIIFSPEQKADADKYLKMLREIDKDIRPSKLGLSWEEAKTESK